jgi:hypothetical protein
MNAIIKEFRQKLHGYIAVNRNLQLDAMIFADDLVLLAASEDDLQHSLYIFKLLAEKHSMEISTEKTKIMAFCGKEPVPSKICLNNKILERVNKFNYLGYKLSFVGELDLPGKISKDSKNMGIINNVLKPSLVQKHTRMRVYKTLVHPLLCYGSEAWTI